MANIRLSTVQELCELDESALNFAPSDQVEHLSDLLDHAESSAEDFFQKNFVTQGMKSLLSTALKRLNGQSSQAVFELRQAMGGGKTHSMLALGLLARNPRLYDHVPSEITTGLPGVVSKVVAINGRTISVDNFVWGDIAIQLGKKSQFSKFWTDGPEAPREDDWITLIGDEPTLILLDELPPYFDYALTRNVGGGTLAQVTTFALSNLLSAAIKLPNTAIVVSNLVGTYQEATRGLSKAIADIAEETKRQALPITPVDLNTNEIYDILRKRLFRKLPAPAEVEKIAEGYGKAITVAERSKSIAKSTEQVADEIIGSYPFHPSVKNIIALFKENENYRQTRGLMQFVSKMIKSVWQGDQKGFVYLIGCQHLDLTIPDVRDEVSRIGKLEGALARDVMSTDGSSHAQMIDDVKDNDAATQVAKLLLTASLSESVDSIKGLNRSTLIEYLIVPDRSTSEFEEAFDELQRECWYLHKKDNDVWYFSNIENLRKRIQQRADTAPSGKIDDVMTSRLASVFAPRQKRAYQDVKALPRIDDIKLEVSRRFLLVLSPDSRTPPEAAQRFLESQVYKNGFCVVAGDGSSMGSLEDKVRRLWAIEKVSAELGANAAYAAELNDEKENAEFEFSSAVMTLFNRVYFPMPVTGDKSKTELKYAALKLAAEKSGQSTTIELNGEAAIEAALVSQGASKLIEDVIAKAETLMTRAEELLWPERVTRIPWADVVQRAQSNSRWPWLPPKGLEQLRDHAHSIGRWNYEATDGYVNKSPEVPKTTANIVEVSYDDKIGEANLNVVPQHAGKTPHVLISTTGDFETDSKILDVNPFKTTATKLWIKVTDPDGEHEQGDAIVWSNRLYLTYELQQIAGRRVVTLNVVPRGEIKWNTDGTNVRDGRIYDGEIALEGSDPVVIYAYAQDLGISTEKQISIAASGTEKVIDITRPARLKKEIKGETIVDTFRILDAAENNKAVFQAASITVGTGSRNISMRMGEEVHLSASEARQLIVGCRKAISDDNAEVRFNVRKINFPTGFELEQFAKDLGEDISVAELEQS